MLNQENIRKLAEKENYQYKVILEADTIKENLKKNNKARIILETKFCSKYQID